MRLKKTNVGDIVRVEWIDIVEVRECSGERIPEPAKCVSYGEVVQVTPFLCIEREHQGEERDRQSFPPGCIVGVKVLRED